MITAVDTNILLDVFIGDPQFGQMSKAALRNSLKLGSLIACEVVWAEVSGQFPSPAEATAEIYRLGVSFTPMTVSSAELTGKAWKAYRSRGGPKKRVIADFMVGAHAKVAADRLLTRDSGYFRTYFPDLILLNPG